MDEDLNFQNILEHYREPCNFGKIKNYTFFAKEKNNFCGDEFKLYIKLSNDKKKVIDIKFCGSGCAISMASFSILTEEIKNKNFQKIKKINDKEIFKNLKIPISPSRFNCALLPLKTLNKAIKNEK